MSCLWQMKIEGNISKGLPGCSLSICGERVQASADCPAVYFNLSIFSAVERVILSAIHSLPVVNSQKKRKIVRNLCQPPKGISYL